MTTSTATPISPLAAFFMPTGQDRPDAISRWIWFSPMRAPIALQLIKSSKYSDADMRKGNKPASLSILKPTRAVAVAVANHLANSARHIKNRMPILT